MAREKKKKEKITYVDDGRSLLDLSGTGRTSRYRDERPPNTFRECLCTYIAAVRMMFLPMLAVLGLLALAFLIVYFLL